MQSNTNPIQISPSLNNNQQINQMQPINPLTQSQVNIHQNNQMNQMNQFSQMKQISSSVNPMTTHQMTSSRMMKSAVPMPVSIPQPKRETAIEKSLKVLQNNFAGTYQFKHVKSCPKVELEMFNEFSFEQNVLLMETNENKMIGIFLGAYFIFIENETLRYALTTLNPNKQPLPIFRPNQCARDDFMVINNSFFLFSQGFQINKVGNDLDLPPGTNANEMFTNQQGEVVNVQINQFHFIEII